MLTVEELVIEGIYHRLILVNVKKHGVHKTSAGAGTNLDEEIDDDVDQIPDGVTGSMAGGGDAGTSESEDIPTGTSGGLGFLVMNSMHPHLKRAYGMTPTFRLGQHLIPALPRPESGQGDNQSQSTSNDQSNLAEEFLAEQGFEVTEDIQMILDTGEIQLMKTTLRSSEIQVELPPTWNFGPSLSYDLSPVSPEEQESSMTMLPRGISLDNCDQFSIVKLQDKRDPSGRSLVLVQTNDGKNRPDRMEAPERRQALPGAKVLRKAKSLSDADPPEAKSKRLLERKMISPAPTPALTKDNMSIFVQQSNDLEEVEEYIDNPEEMLSPSIVKQAERIAPQVRDTEIDSGIWDMVHGLESKISTRDSTRENTPIVQNSECSPRKMVSMETGTTEEENDLCEEKEEEPFRLTGTYRMFNIGDNMECVVTPLEQTPAESIDYQSSTPEINTKSDMKFRALENSQPKVTEELKSNSVGTLQGLTSGANIEETSVCRDTITRPAAEITFTVESGETDNDSIQSSIMDIKYEFNGSLPTSPFGSYPSSKASSPTKLLSHDESSSTLVEISEYTEIDLHDIAIKSELPSIAQASAINNLNSEPMCSTNPAKPPCAKSPSSKVLVTSGTSTTELESTTPKPLEKSSQSIAKTDRPNYMNADPQKAQDVISHEMISKKVEQLQYSERPEVITPLGVHQQTLNVSPKAGSQIATTETSCFENGHQSSASSKAEPAQSLPRSYSQVVKSNVDEISLKKLPESSLQAKGAESSLPPAPSDRPIPPPRRKSRHKQLGEGQQLPRQPSPRRPSPRQPSPRQPSPRQPSPRQPSPRQPLPRQPSPRQQSDRPQSSHEYSSPSSSHDNLLEKAHLDYSFTQNTSEGRSSRQRSPDRRLPRQHSPRQKSPSGKRLPGEPSSYNQRPPRQQSPYGHRSSRQQSPYGQRSPRQQSPYGQRSPHPDSYYQHRSSREHSPIRQKHPWHSSKESVESYNMAPSSHESNTKLSERPYSILTRTDGHGRPLLHKKTASIESTYYTPPQSPSEQQQQGIGDILRHPSHNYVASPPLHRAGQSGSRRNSGSNRPGHHSWSEYPNQSYTSSTPRRPLSDSTNDSGISVALHPQSRIITYRDPMSPADSHSDMSDSYLFAESSDGEEAASMYELDLPYDVPDYLRHPDWMSQLPEDLHTVPLTQIIIPGSHISLSIDRDMRMDMDFSKCNYEMAEFLRKLPNLAIFNNFRGLMKKIWKAWMPKQTLTIPQQLEAGVRYLDLRITKLRGALYGEHGLYTRQLKRYLKEIREFLESHPKEIIILHFQKLDQLNRSDKRHLVTTLFQMFGARLARSAIPGATTLEFLWKNRKQVIAVFPDEDMNLLQNHIFHALIWSDFEVTDSYPKTKTTEELQSYLLTLDGDDSVAVKASADQKLHILKAVLSPDMTMVFGEFKYRSMREMTQEETEGAVLEWIFNDPSRKLNIIAMDYVGLGTAVSEILQLNFPKRETVV